MPLGRNNGHNTDNGAHLTIYIWYIFWSHLLFSPFFTLSLLLIARQSHPGSHSRLFLVPPPPLRHVPFHMVITKIPVYQVVYTWYLVCTYILEVRAFLPYGTNQNTCIVYTWYLVCTYILDVSYERCDFSAEVLFNNINIWKVVGCSPPSKEYHMYV